MMEEANIFIRKFLSMDYFVRIARWKEKDDAVFEQQLKELNGMYHGEVDSDVYRVKPSDPQEFDHAEQMIDGLQEKKLFRLEKLGQDEGRYAAYVSSSFAGDDTIFTILHFGAIGEEMKILAEFDLCIQCKGTGLINGQPCGACSGEGWLSRAGIKFKKL